MILSHTRLSFVFACYDAVDLRRLRLHKFRKFLNRVCDLWKESFCKYLVKYLLNFKATPHAPPFNANEPEDCSAALSAIGTAVLSPGRASLPFRLLYVGTLNYILR